MAPEPERLELELTLPAEEVTQVAHAPILAALRKGRITLVAEEIRWLDTPGGAVMGSGKLIEVPRRGARRMVSRRLMRFGTLEWYCHGRPCRLPPSALPGAGRRR